MSERFDFQHHLQRLAEFRRELENITTISEERIAKLRAVCTQIRVENPQSQIAEKILGQIQEAAELPHDSFDVEKAQRVLVVAEKIMTTLFKPFDADREDTLKITDIGNRKVFIVGETHGSVGAIKRLKEVMAQLHGIPRNNILFITEQIAHHSILNWDPQFQYPPNGLLALQDIAEETDVKIKLGILPRSHKLSFDFAVRNFAALSADAPIKPPRQHVQNTELAAFIANLHYLDIEMRSSERGYSRDELLDNCKANVAQSVGVPLEDVTRASAQHSHHWLFHNATGNEPVTDNDTIGGYVLNKASNIATRQHLSTLVQKAEQTHLVFATGHGHTQVVNEVLDLNK